MNGKLRKTALGMSVLMCAGMLFTCALPAKAANVCQHMSRCYLGEYIYLDENYYDDDGHFFIKETRACCETCGQIVVLRSEIDHKEDHDIYTVIHWETGFSGDICANCNYSRTYYVAK